MPREFLNTRIYREQATKAVMAANTINGHIKLMYTNNGGCYKKTRWKHMERPVFNSELYHKNQ